MQKIIENNFGIVLLIFGIIGYFFPEIFLPMNEFADKFLMFALFLGFLKIDCSEISHLNKNKGRMTIFIIIYMILLPLLFFLLSVNINPDLRLGLFLLTVMSSAVVAPLLAGFLKLKTLWATVFVVSTSFLVPFTAPLLLEWCFGVNTEISFKIMLLFLSKIIFIPAMLAFICKKYLYAFSKQIKKTSGFLGVSCMSIFLAILIAKNQSSIEQNLFSTFALEILIGLFILFLTLFTIGYLAPARTQKEKLTNSIMFGNMNNGLAILLAAEFFSPEVLLVVLLSEIPWVLAQPIFTKFVQWKLSNSS